MGKLSKLELATLMASAAAIVVPAVLSITPAYAGGGGSGGTVIVSEGSCSVCSLDITIHTPTGAIITMKSGDPFDPVDQQNTANWGDIFFSYGIPITFEIFSADEPGDPALLQAAINEALTLSPTFEPDNIDIVTTVPFPGGLQALVLQDNDGPAGVPEPGSVALLGAGVAALALLRRRRSEKP